jgi:hypothetical protein
VRVCPPEILKESIVSESHIFKCNVK